MSQNKTVENDANVDDYINSIDDDQKRQDCRLLITILQEITGYFPKMWGTALIGFGRYHYKYESGREGDFFVAGFSPRKANISIYIMSGFKGYDDLLSSLGKHKIGKSCLYIKRLSDIDLTMLKELISKSVEYMRKTYPCR